MSERSCRGCDGHCFSCSGSMKRKRKDAAFCCSKCYWKTWARHHPREDLQDVQRSPDHRRQGAHSERGTRGYFLPEDAAELREYAVTASPRLRRVFLNVVGRLDNLPSDG